MSKCLTARSLMLATSGMLRRFNMKIEIALAVMPAVTIICVLTLLEAFSKQQLLFASLASSAFLIYLDPKHPTNSVRTLIIAQVSAALIGYLVYLVLGPGYVSAAVSMVVCTVVMIAAKAMHPPAVSSAMTFAFQYTKPDTVMMFLMAIVLLVVLIVLQRVSLWLLHRLEGRTKKPLQTEIKDALTSNLKSKSGGR